MEKVFGEQCLQVKRIADALKKVLQPNNYFSGIPKIIFLHITPGISKS